MKQSGSLSRIARLTRSLATLAICLVVGIFTRIPAHAQPPLPQFEPGFEGEIWKTQPPDKIGRRVQPPCLTEQDWEGDNQDLDNDGFEDNPGINDGVFMENPCVSGPVAGPGVSGPDELYLPVGVAVYDAPTPTLADRRIFVADRYNNRIAVFSPNPDGSWNPLYYPAADWNKTGPDGVPPGQLWHPEHIAVDHNGHLWVADLYNARIAVFDVVDAPPARIMGQRVASIDLGGLLPYGIALNADAQWGVAGGRAAVIAQDYTTAETHLIVLDTQSGAEVGRHVGGISDTPGDFDQTTAVSYHRRGAVDRLVVADSLNNRFQVFDTDGSGVPTGTPYTFGDVPLHENNDPLAPEVIESLVAFPYTVFVDSRGRIVASDSGGNRLVAYELVFPASGGFYAKYLFQLNARGGLDGTPRGVGEDADGSLYVVDTGNNEVEVFEIPALAVVDVALSNNAPRVGVPFTAEFSLMIPYPKTSLGAVTPRCDVLSGPVTKLSNPIAVPPTEDLSPPEGGSFPIVPVGATGGRVYRYSCGFVVNSGGTGDFSIELFGSAGAVESPRKAALGHVSDCGGGTCENNAPATSAAIATGSDGPYNQAVLDPGAPPAILGYFKVAVIRLTANDSQPTGTPTRIRRIYWQWLGAPFGQPLSNPCPGEPFGSALECADFSAAPRQTIRTFDVLAEQNGIRSLEYWAEDFSGNLSARKTITVAVDSTPPDIVQFVSVTPAAGMSPDSTPWWKSDVAITYAFSDNLTANERVTLTPPLRDGNYGKVLVGTGNAQGFDLTATIGLEDLATNAVEYELRDLLEHRFNIDRGAPVTTPRVGALATSPVLTNNQIFTTPPSIRLWAADPLLAGNPLSGVAATFYTLDNGPMQQYTGAPITVAPNAWGNHRLEYWSTDYATNEEFATAAVHKVVNFYLNDVPDGVADTATTPQGVSVDIDVLANDLDENDNSPGDDPLSIVGLTQPAAGRGTVAVVAGKVRYTPPSPTFFTTPSTPVNFTYQARDSHNGTSAATTVNVTVSNANDPPVAVNDFDSTTIDTPRLINVLANDSDPDPGDVLQIDPGTLSDPPHGSVTIVGPPGLQQIQYTPDPGYSGTDSFTYRARDTAGAVSSAALVSLTVRPASCVWIRPGLTDGQVSGLRFKQFGVAEARIGDLLRTGTHEMSLGRTTGDPWRTAQFGWINGQAEPFALVYDGNSVVFTLGAGSRMKTLTLSSHGHDHDACEDRDHDEDGDDDDDDRSRFDLNTLLIRARGETASGTMSLSDLVLDGIPLPAFSAPAGSANAQTLALIGLDQPTFTLTGTARISWTGTWNGSPSRSNKVAFQVMGGHIRNIVGCAGVNAAPAAQDDAATAVEDGSATIDVLANDSDPDGDAIEIKSVSNPPHGRTVITSNGKIKYTPDRDFSGTDTFTYTVTDSDRTDTATVTVTVTGVNDSPSANNKRVRTPKNTAVSLNLLAGASDPDGDTLTVVAVTDPPKGTVVLNGSVATYTPDRNFKGTDSFKYTVSDGHGGQVTKTVTVKVGIADDDDDGHDGRHGHHDGDGCSDDRDDRGRH